MPGQRQVVVVRMYDVDDRYVTRPVQIPPWARFIGLFVPGISDAGNVGVEVSQFPHVFNYPAPGYFRAKPGLNPWVQPLVPNLSFAEAGILAEWRMKEAAANGYAVDEVSGYTLAVQGNPTQGATLATAGLGKGVTFDGTADCLSVAITGAANLDITTGDFSIETIAKLTSGSNASKTLVEHRGATDGKGYSMYTDASEHLMCLIEDAGGEVTLDTGVDVAAGAVAHLVMTVDRDSATGLKAYINGAVQGTPSDISANTLTLSNTGAFCIGGDSDGANLVTGTIGFTRVYNRALSAEEVLMNYRILVGNQWPGWYGVADLAGALHDAAVSGTTKVFADLSSLATPAAGMFIRAKCATQQTTAGEYDFVFVFQSHD